VEPVQGSENLLARINQMAKDLGVESSAGITIVRLKSSDDPDKKILELVQGSWDNKAPWFVIDENERIYVLSSIESILQLIRSLGEARHENFNLKLEKAILENLPVDFSDVWVVAMSEIQRRLATSEDKSQLDIDVQELLREIKKNHPNLFINLNNFPFQQPEQQ
jgi:hypothetical protein